MDDTRFTALLAKLQAATWSLSNAISNTKMFTCEINDQRVKVVSFGHSNPVYINGQRLNLTDSQVETMLAFVEQLSTDFDSEIQAAESEKRQDMATALNRILE